MEVTREEERGKEHQEFFEGRDGGFSLKGGKREGFGRREGKEKKWMGRRKGRH